VFDFNCGDCGAAFEAFLQSVDDTQRCPECGSSSLSRQPTLQLSIRTGNTRRRGRVIDMSSKSCPCGCAGSSQAHR
jgi:putative FmdB family regulatory protein